MPFFFEHGVNYFQIQDIAAMKMQNLCGRGKKKDLFDIYVLKENFGWPMMLEWFERKYEKSQLYFLWRSINYFKDADEDPDIQGNAPYNKGWNKLRPMLRQIVFYS